MSCQDQLIEFVSNSLSKKNRCVTDFGSNEFGMLRWLNNSPNNVIIEFGNRIICFSRIRFVPNGLERLVYIDSKPRRIYKMSDELFKTFIIDTSAYDQLLDDDYKFFKFSFDSDGVLNVCGYTLNEYEIEGISQTLDRLGLLEERYEKLVRES